VSHARATLTRELEEIDRRGLANKIGVDFAGSAAAVAAVGAAG
jgi:hypothetical protein